jgi:PAS domain-containing protein
VGANQHPVELIMARGFAANLITPAFLVDRAGTLIFFNEAAGDLLGVAFEEMGELAAEDWGSRFEPVGMDEAPLAVEELPLSIALTEDRPVHGSMRIRSARRELHDIEVTAFPIVGVSGQAGALAIFWDSSR